MFRSTEVVDVILKTSKEQMNVSQTDDDKTSKTSRNENVFRLAMTIVSLLFEKRRLIEDKEEFPPDIEREAEPHLEKLITAIETGQPIHMILPGFPAKSPNRRKTLGALPDLADKLGLQNLYSLCKRIESIYPPGGRLTICSDGRVFSDLVRIPDEHVSAYGDYLKRYCKDTFGDIFTFMSLDDVYPKITDFDILREELLIDFGEPIRELRWRCKNEKEAKAMYRGITRFLFEDYRGLECFNDFSNTAIQKLARQMAYRTIQRSNAWTRLLEDRYPESIRLSVHPQYRVSGKIGIYLVDAEDVWMTPWHAVAVKENNKYVLRKCEQAATGAMLAFSEGRPSHFEVISQSATHPPLTDTNTEPAV